MTNHAPVDRDPLLGLGMIGLALGIAGYVVLGPLGLGGVSLRTSAAAMRQVEGGDLAALVVVVPVCVVVGVLALRGNPAAPLLGLAPCLFATYTYSQIFLGSEFATRPGNVERYFPLFAVLVVTAATLGIHCWRSLGTVGWTGSARLRHALGWLMASIAAFVLFGIHVRSYMDVAYGHPSDAYLAAPTAFWVVKFWDLVVVVPTTLAVGVGLLRNRAWAVKPAVGLMGAVVLLACSVTAMAVRMLATGDPDGSPAMVVGCAAVTSAALGLTVLLYRPLISGDDGHVTDLGVDMPGNTTRVPST